MAGGAHRPHRQRVGPGARAATARPSSCARTSTPCSRPSARTAPGSTETVWSGPGVGDDSVAVAALSEVARQLAATPGVPVWLLATVGEEGLGDLKGVRGALAAPAGPVGALIAVEGNYLGRVSRVGVGSLRWRVTVRGPGGHAWEASSAPSAVHAMASMITELARVRAYGAATTINVGARRRRRGDQRPRARRVVRARPARGRPAGA